MTSIEEIKQSVWYKKFLEARGLSEEDFDKAENKQELQTAFDDFMLEKYNDPLISTPEDEDNSLRPEVLERQQQAAELEHKHAGYHINDELDNAAYLCAVRSLSVSDDEITEENLQKHIAAESNRIATEYYSALLGLSVRPDTHEEKKWQTAGPKVIDLAGMVAQGKSREEIYSTLFAKGYRPNREQEKAASSIVAHSNISAVKGWLGKLGVKSGKFLDKIQEFEKKYPVTGIATSMAMSAAGLGAPYMAYRMAVGARGLYKQLKAGNLSPMALLTDGKARTELLQNAGSFVRLLPGGRAVMAANAVSKIFTKSYRQTVKVQVEAIKDAAKEIGQSGGRKGWKKLFGSTKSVLLMVGGTAVAAAGVYGAYHHFQADALDSPDAGQVPPAPEQAAVSSEQAQETAAQQKEAGLTEPPAIDLSNLSEMEQKKLDLLLKIYPAQANALINDGDWHSSAELQKMWETPNGISDDIKRRMVEVADKCFDDKGGIKDETLKKLAAKWLEEQNAAQSQPEAPEINKPTIPPVIHGDIDFGGVKPVEAPNIPHTIDDHDNSDITKIKVRNDDVKIVSNGEDGREVTHTDAQDVKAYLDNLGIDKVKYHDNGEISVRQENEGGATIKYGLNDKGEYTSLNRNGEPLPQEALDKMNATPEHLEANKKLYQELMNMRESLDETNTAAAPEPVAVQETPTGKPAAAPEPVAVQETPSGKPAAAPEPVAVQEAPTGNTPSGDAAGKAPESESKSEPEGKKEALAAAQMRESLVQDISKRGLENFKISFMHESNRIYDNGARSSSSTFFGEADNGYAMTGKSGVDTFIVDDNGNGHFQLGIGDTVRDMSYTEAKELTDAILKCDTSIDTDSVQKFMAMSGALYETDSTAYVKDMAGSMGIVVDDKTTINTIEGGSILLSDNGVSITLSDGHSIGCSVDENGELKFKGGIYGVVSDKNSEDHLDTLTEAAKMNGKGDTPIGRALEKAMSENGNTSGEHTLESARSDSSHATTAGRTPTPRQIQASRGGR